MTLESLFVFTCEVFDSMSIPHMAAGMSRITAMPECSSGVVKPAVLSSTTAALGG